MTPDQARASHPAASAWVSASAGTGKTHVLTNRVLRLLLAGVAPERILCLTYTKAAAAEMANRIQSRLAAWAVDGEDQLAASIDDLEGAWPDEARLAGARRLFARVLDAPGGLKIQTIHAFCQSLLGRFPVEAGLPPRFTALDDLTAAELLAEAQLQVLSAPAHADALGRLSGLAGEDRVAALVGAVIAKRARLPDGFATAGGREAADRAVRDSLGFGTERLEEPAMLARHFRAARRRHPQALKAAAQALAQGGVRDQAAAQALAGLFEIDDPVAAVDRYRQAFCTAEGGLRASLASKAVAAAQPTLVAWMTGEAAALDDLAEAMARAAVALASGALIALAGAVLGRYERLKALRRAVDYDDMILKSLALLTRGGSAAWVLYKLDGGIDHLLIDEAQDTSPAQWQVVEALTQEFFAGAGAVGRPRTIFAVGDPKQSIYSFQGADPAAFVAGRHRFGQAAAAAEQRFEAVDLALSFRSVPAVLALVDRVFADPLAGDGVAGKTPLRHQAHRLGAAGTVEFWPLEEGEAAAAMDGWTPQVSARRGRSAQTALAARLAAQIASWVGNAVLPARGRTVRAGDIMVLVRRRTPFIGALVSALKAAGITVSGSDRMAVAEQLAVKDLLALGRFALLPADDLTLAIVLKGPFIGFDDGALFALAASRPRGQPLWRALAARRDERPAFHAAWSWLAALLERVDYVTPFGFFNQALQGGGRSRLLGRLGPEAAEPIDEFLSLALRHQAEQAPSLQAFLHRVEHGELVLKRDLEKSRDEVRILTVHAAKGLEAPIVVLPDTTQLPGEHDPLLWLPQGVPLWPVAAANEVGPVAALRQAANAAAQQEYRRLLYVALTRAEDRLIVCGWRTAKAAEGFAPGSWYDLVARAMPAACPAVELEPGFAVRRWSEAQDAPIAERPRDLVGGIVPEPLPVWAGRPAPAEPQPSRPLSPSRAQDADLPALSPLGEGTGRRFLRGRLVHRLLELLPERPAGERALAARRFLAQPAHGLDAAMAEALAAEVLAILDHPDFAPVFGPGSRAEVPLTAELAGEVILGQLDRLVVLDDRVLIVDYKTDRPSPASVAAVAPGYLRQLALYRAAVAPMFPRRAVEAALLWTETARLMPIPGDLLDAALAAILGSRAPASGPA